MDDGGTRIIGVGDHVYVGPLEVYRVDPATNSLGVRYDTGFGPRAFGFPMALVDRVERSRCHQAIDAAITQAIREIDPTGTAVVYVPERAFVRAPTKPLRGE